MNRRTRLSQSAWFVAAVDALLILACFWFARMLRYREPGLTAAGHDLDTVMGQALWIAAIAVIMLYLFSLYQFSGRLESSKYYYNLVISHLVMGVFLIGGQLFFHPFLLAGSLMVIAFVLQFFVLFAARAVLFAIQSHGLKKKRALLIVNDPSEDMILVERMLDKGDKWFDIYGIVQNSESSQLHDYSSEIDLFLLSPNLESTVKAEIIRYAGANRKEVLLIPSFYEMFVIGAETQSIGDLILYSIVPTKLSLLDKILKRAIDIVGAGILLLLTSPLMLLAWILVPLTSKGKALYSQERVGLDERSFKVLKFRSMVDNAEKSTGPVLAAERDNRITKLGKFMRATRIDELPQLFNVLRGDMSLVGPRPEREFFTNEFKKELPHYSYRFMVKPGITGLAQVMGNYSTLPADKLRFDLLYIKNYSPIMDLKILLQTIIVVLQREQSKGVSTAGFSSVSSAMKRLLNNQANMAVFKESK
ncbi:sugar transferase [Paenibacillus albus]|uniref:Sugar transferase n=1 Tax=Paenibacillus albus TaxID=2495582 RepID=A0A3S9AC60_9BACL|nr:sugar transferase [Paenibacillus albus]AZN43300.1 sugar transferase [Paenibacillus albus]